MVVFLISSFMSTLSVYDSQIVFIYIFLYKRVICAYNFEVAAVSHVDSSSS